MPEGDTVARLARTLGAQLNGKVLHATDFRVPAHATADLSDWVISDVVARGKHLLIRTVAPDGVRHLSLHSHLRMDGSWRLFPRAGAARATRRRQFPGADVRVVLTTAESYAVARAVTEVRLIPTADEGRMLNHLGPDPLGDDWDAAIAVDRMKAASTELLSTALLDQRIMTGVGNVFRCEVLFLAGVNPWRLVADVPLIADVVDCAARLLQENASRRWRVTTEDDRRGRELWVYGRARQPCRRCGNAVRSGTVGSGAPDAHDAPRLIYWCATCQQ